MVDYLLRSFLVILTMDYLRSFLQPWWKSNWQAPIYRPNYVYINYVYIRIQNTTASKKMLKWLEQFSTGRRVGEEATKELQVLRYAKQNSSHFGGSYIIFSPCFKKTILIFLQKNKCS